MRRQIVPQTLLSQRTGVLLLGLICIVALVVYLRTATRQEQAGVDEQAAVEKSVLVAEAESDSDCRRCHLCDRPAPENKCLQSCTRRMSRGAAAYAHDYQGPDIVILNELEDAYLPVPFDHKGHAEMAEMAEGCVTCHHYTPEGQQHPACKTCHDISGAGTDIAKPSLKGAYHRQCLNCHKDWIDETDCAKCHMPKASRPEEGEGVVLTKDDIMGRMHPLGQMHPPIPEPDTEIYGVTSKQAAGSQAIFRHHEHVHRFGLKCVECHYKESCTRCHAQDREQKRSRVPSEHHKPCIRCHGSDTGQATAEMAGRCRRCHWWPGEPKPKRFDHAGTGWPLSRYHQGRSCRVCHKAIPFAKLDRECDSCHSDWEPDNFDHTLTGQILDGNHAETDCEECHGDRKFDQPPSCDECHDEDEGIAFPSQRPGPAPTSAPAS
ncbi:MAG: cytochrome c3 family protein [Phycisphaerae bacterium]|nr:cytochrome c3 family protein [Phycisphaerae bacterium]